MAGLAVNIDHIATLREARKVNYPDPVAAALMAELAGADAPDRIDGVSVVEALKGGNIANPHRYLYWDYGHCRTRYDQAVRLGDWKGIRLGRQSPLELYDLSRDIGEQTDLAAAIQDSLQSESGKRLAGVIVLSDGAQRVDQPGRYSLLLH